MKNIVLKPIFNTGVTNPTISYIEDGSRIHSDVAGFNWRSLDFPYMHTHNHWEILLVLNGKVEHIINTSIGQQKVTLVSYVLTTFTVIAFSIKRKVKL